MIANGSGGHYPPAIADVGVQGRGWHCV